jgi:hypothetical protein
VKIRIPIPDRVMHVYDRFEDWANVPVWLWPFHILRIDLILTALFLFCVGWYGYTGGWAAAVTGGLLFVFIAMCALWIWRR